MIEVTHPAYADDERIEELTRKMREVMDLVPEGRSMRDDFPDLYEKWHKLRTEQQQRQRDAKERYAQRELDSGEWINTDERMLALSRREADQWAKQYLAGQNWTPPARLTQDDIDALADPEPLIDGIIDQGTVGVLSGETQAGKSFLAWTGRCRWRTARTGTATR